MAVMTETEALEELRERMIGQRSDSGATVIDVRYEYPINEDAEEYLNVVLILSYPPPERDTWPTMELLDLVRRGRAEVERLRLAPPYFVDWGYLPGPYDLDDEAKAAA